MSTKAEAPFSKKPVSKAPSDTSKGKHDFQMVAKYVIRKKSYLIFGSLVSLASFKLPASTDPVLPSTNLASKKQANKKKSGARSKLLVSRRAARRSDRADHEEPIELGAGSSTEDDDSTGSESEPDTDEEAELQIKKLALEKLSLEKTAPVSSPKHDSDKKQQPSQRLNQNGSRPSSTQNQQSQSAPQSRESTPASGATSPLPKKNRRNKKAKAKLQAEQTTSPAPVAPAPSSTASQPSESSNKAKPSSKQNRLSKQGLASPKPSPSPKVESGSTERLGNCSKVGGDDHSGPKDKGPKKTLAKDESNKEKPANSKKASDSNKAHPKDSVGVKAPADDLSTWDTTAETSTSNWGDEPIGETSHRPSEDQARGGGGGGGQSIGRPASRGRGGRAAVEARVEYRKKLAEDPRFVPHLGEFWGHDDRYRGAGLKNFGERGGFRGRFMGR